MTAVKGQVCPCARLACQLLTRALLHAGVITLSCSLLLPAAPPCTPDVPCNHTLQPGESLQNVSLAAAGPDSH